MCNFNSTKTKSESNRIIKHFYLPCPAVQPPKRNARNATVFGRAPASRWQLSATDRKCNQCVTGPPQGPPPPPQASPPLPQASPPPPQVSPPGQELTECPVCFDPVHKGPASQVKFSVVEKVTTLWCPNGHGVCIPCLRRLIRSDSMGLYFKCPTCRAGSVVDNHCAHVLIAGSWNGAHAAGGLGRFG